MNNELRIGNLVYDCDGSVHTIASGADIDGLWKHIFLTEEKLVKFGFEENSTGDYVLNDFLLGYITKDDNLQYEHTNPLMKWEIIDVLHVHQLQNLYFALKGTELTLKGTFT